MSSNDTVIDGNNVGVIFDLLKKGSKEVKLGHDKDIVLVLGNTGAGKSTLTQFIAGNNEDLRAVEVTKDSNEFIIVDKGERISRNSTIISQTLFPELIVNRKHKVAFYDCPGFSDTRSPAHEIAAAYSVKRVIDSCNSVKLLFAVNYSSLRKGVDRKDFILLLKHANQLIKDIDKFKNGIAIVATKVDNTIYKKNRSYVLVPDDVIINTIADFLNSVKIDLTSESFSKEHQFAKNASKFIDILLEKDGENYQKIAIFRRPDEPGLISESILLQEGKQNIENIVYKKMEYVEISEKDFGFTVSSDSLLYVGDLSEEINKSIIKEITLLQNKIIKHYENEKRRSFDLFYLNKKLNDGLYLFSKYTINSEDKAKPFIKNLKKIINGLNIDINSDNIQNIEIFYSYLSFLSLVSGKITSQPSRWVAGIEEIKTYFEKSFKYYEFLVKLQSVLSEYFVQKDVNKFNISKLMSEGENIQQNLGSVLLQLKPSRQYTDLMKLYYEIKEVALNEADEQVLKEVFRYSLNYKVENICLEGNKLLVRAPYVKLSDSKLYVCPDLIKYLEVFALNTVFIDSDFVNNERLQLVIMAPLWEVVGNRTINLDGRKGRYLPQAGSSFHFRGQDGEPGLPGEPGGHFMGISGRVEGGDLTVTSNGGTGGNGQKGGDGGRGGNGEDAPLGRGSVVRSVFNEYGPEEDWKENNWNYVMTSSDDRVFVAWYYYRVFGRYGGRGKDGGNGGVGGLGGMPGSVKFIELNDSKKVRVSMERGRTGPDGGGGDGGSGGWNGSDRYVECKTERIVIVFISPTSCETQYIITNGRAESGVSGLAGVNSNGRRNPEAPLNDIKRPSDIVNRYKVYIRDNLQNNMLKFKYIKFLQSIENNENINSLYDTLGFVNDLRGLEPQYYKFDENSKMLSFYESLLNRIENYASNPKLPENTIQHKKVLSVLYTALLSKIANINNSYKQDLIVDVPKYMDIISENIRQIKVHNNNVAINNNNIKFKGGIEVKIKKALEVLTDQVLPEIDIIFKEVDKEIETLTDELTILKKSFKDEKELLTIKIQNLEDAISMKSLLGPLYFIGNIINTLLPLGNMIMPLLEDGRTMLTDFIGSIENDVTPIIGLIFDIFFKFLETNAALNKEDSELFGLQLKDIVSILNNYLKSAPDSKIQSLYDKVKHMENDLSNNKTVTEGNDVFSLNHLKKELQKSIAEKKNTTKNSTRSDETVINGDINVINNIQEILNISSIAPALYLSSRRDKEKLGVIRETVNKINNKLNEIETFKENIQTAIIPMTRNLNNFVNIATKNFSTTNHHVELDVRKWRLQTVVNRVKFEIGRIGKEFKLNSKLDNCFKELSGVLSAVVDVYNRIEDYQENAKLADYIADVSSEQVMGIEIQDRDLQRAVLDLDVNIKSNLILGQYDKAMIALAQVVFPFGNTYLNEFALIPTLNDTDILVTNVVRNLNYIKNKLEESSITVNKFDEFIHKDIKFNSKDFLPFYVWESDTYKHLIDKLLDGEEITLYADIKNGIDKDSVKFNNIGIHLKTSNVNLQKLLDEDLNHFQVTMKHLGISYYRCDSSYYYVPSDDLTFVYHLKKNPNGSPVIKNQVYNKISNNHEILSPYALWTIRLSPVNDHIISLRKYKNETIDLELEGSGQYIDRDDGEVEMCENMDKFYNSDQSMSEFDGPYEQEEMDTDFGVTRIRRSLENQEVCLSEGYCGSGSSIKSSAINYLINSFVTGLSFVKFFNPLDGLKNMFGTKEQPYERFGDSLLHVSDIFDENFHTAEKIDSSTLQSSGNMLLWNVLLRKLSGAGAKDITGSSSKTGNIDDNYSHSLAYSYYSSKHVNYAPEEHSSNPVQSFGPCDRTKRCDFNQISLEIASEVKTECPYSNRENIYLLL